jgi:hypothetical protein
VVRCRRCCGRTQHVLYLLIHLSHSSLISLSFFQKGGGRASSGGSKGGRRGEGRRGTRGSGRNCGGKTGKGKSAAGERPGKAAEKARRTPGGLKTPPRRKGWVAYVFKNKREGATFFMCLCFFNSLLSECETDTLLHFFKQQLDPFFYVFAAASFLHTDGKEGCSRCGTCCRCSTCCRCCRPCS